jgi:hypothetical protein
MSGFGPIPDTEPPNAPDIRRILRRIRQIDGDPRDGCALDGGPGDFILTAAQELSAMIDDNDTPWAMLPEHVRVMRYVQAERIIGVYMARVVPEKVTDLATMQELAQARTTIHSLQLQLERQTPTIMLREMNRLKEKADGSGHDVLNETLKAVAWSVYFHDLMLIAGVRDGIALRDFVTKAAKDLPTPAPEAAIDDRPLPVVDGLQVEPEAG